MRTTIGLLAIASFAFAQDAPPSGPAPDQQPTVQQDSGWRRLNDQAPALNQPVDQAPPAGYQNQYPPPPQNQGPVPPTLTIKPGTYLTVRVNQVLSSDRNQAGDAFSASLEQPVIVDGVVVAQRGQTIGGRVSEAKKAGRVEGTSRLGIQLTDLTLVDGQNLPIQSELVTRNGGTSTGRDAGAIAGTTALGAALGAAAGWGTGAAIGAGSGAAVGLVGVLLTRGKPTYIGPESVLTFRVDNPVTISTERAPQAFRFVEPNDYRRPANLQTRAPAYGPGPAPAPAPYYYGGYGYPYPYYYGPGYGYYWGPSFYFRGGGYYRGYRR